MIHSKFVIFKGAGYYARLLFCMKMIFQVCILLFLSLFASANQEAQRELILKNKSIQILPVDLRFSKWGEVDEKDGKQGVSRKYAIVFANLLKRSGCNAVATHLDHQFDKIDSSEVVESELRNLITKNNDGFDFTLFLIISSGDELNYIRFWICDKGGNVVLRGNESKFEQGRPRNPMASFLYVMGMIGNSSDIEDPLKGGQPAPPLK